MFRVVTDLAVFGFDEDTRELKLLALKPGVTREQVQDNTGFSWCSTAQAETIEPPTKHELDVLRELDPDGSTSGNALSDRSSQGEGIRNDSVQSKTLRYFCPISRPIRKCRMRQRWSNTA